MQHKNVVNEVTRWLETTVVELNLCPFAKKPLAEDSVRFAVTSVDGEAALLRQLGSELTLLQNSPKIETTLLIHPQVMTTFADYNQFLSQAEQLLADLGFEGMYQLASFHPDYQFAGTEADAAENYSNRSPYPMLHLLREESVEKAIASHPDTEQIPQRNIERLNALGRQRLASMLLNCFDKGV